MVITIMILIIQSGGVVTQVINSTIINEILIFKYYTVKHTFCDTIYLGVSDVFLPLSFHFISRIMSKYSATLEYGIV